MGAAQRNSHATPTRAEELTARDFASPLNPPTAHDISASARVDWHAAPQEALATAHPAAVRPAHPSSVLSAAELLRAGGPAKADIKFLGITIWRRSTAYKRVLGDLAQYHTAMRERSVIRLGDAQRADALKRAYAAAERLQGSIETYVAGGSWRRYSHQPHIAAVGDALKLDFHVLHAEGILHPNPHLNATVDALASLLGKGLDTNTVTDIATAYDAMKVPLNKASVLGLLTDADFEGDARALGSGGFNEVWKCRCRTPAGSPPSDVVVKYDWVGTPTRGIPLSAVNTEIDPDRPNWSCRSVATYRYARLLGMDIVPRTEFVVHKGKLGTAMGFAEGISPTVQGPVRMPLPMNVADFLRTYPDLVNEFAKEQGFARGSLTGDTLVVENGGPTADRSAYVVTDYNDATLRRELVKLQWLDCATGQVDRHGHNYVVRRLPEGGVLGVTAIDNDVAFGKNVADPNLVAGRRMEGDAGTSEDSGFHGALLPDVIDRETCEAFMAQTSESVRAELEGLLSAEELDAQLMRLAAIRAHLQSGRVRVIDTLVDWVDAETTLKLAMDLVNTRLAEAELANKLPAAERQAALEKVLTDMSADENDLSATSYCARDAGHQARAKVWNMFVKVSGDASEPLPMLDVQALIQIVRNPS